MNRAFRLLLTLGACSVLTLTCLQGEEPVVSDIPGPDDFPLIRNGIPAAAIYTDAYSAEPVRAAAADLAADIGKVSGAPPPPCSTDAAILRDEVVIAGELGRSRIIDTLAEAGALKVRGLQGAWESWSIQVVDHPVAGVDRALIVVGSDMRGTIYGLYALSEAMGVSPWAWWADVPIHRRSSVFVARGPCREGPPAVKYRGLCLNTMDPARWTATRARVLELILRLRGNCLWPPSEPDGTTFNLDSATVRLAVGRGVVLGLPVEDPLPPDSAAAETVFMVGRRSGRTDWAGEDPGPLVSSQRTLLQAWISPDAASIPQVFCPWRESLDVISRNPALPRDITLVWPDDGFGHLRRLAGCVPASRTGQAGVLYHLARASSPVGGSWISPPPPALIREELTRAWDRGARRLWVAAAGTIKPDEIDTEFFLRLAWNPGGVTAATVNAAVARQLARDFGPAEAADIADVLDRCSQLNGQRRPEDIGRHPAGSDAASQAFSPLVNGDEIQGRLDDFRDLAARAAAIRDKLPPDERAAYRELVLHPVECSALANIRGLNLALYRIYGAEGRASAPALLTRVKDADKLIGREIRQYDRLSDGKWKGLMKVLPRAPLPSGSGQRNAPVGPPPARPVLRLEPEGADAQPAPEAAASLPEFAAPCPAVRTIDVFNGGARPLRWTARSGSPWIRLDHTSGTDDDRIRVAVDWDRVPAGEEARGTITVSGGGGSASVAVRAWNPGDRIRMSGADFLEVGGCVSIDPVHPSRRVSHAGDFWTVLPGLGYRGSVIQADAPPSAEESPPRASTGAARLEYRVWLRTPGAWTVLVRTLPAWPGRPGTPLRYAIALDGEEPRIVPLPDYAGEADPHWQADVLNNASVTSSVHPAAAGLHTLKVWRVDEGVAFDSILMENQPECPRGYLWPAETRIRKGP